MGFYYIIAHLGIKYWTLLSHFTMYGDSFSSVSKTIKMMYYVNELLYSELLLRS